MKKVIYITVLVLSSFCLTGCWNFNELNELAIVTGMAIEKDGDDKYKVSVQIMNTQASDTTSTASNTPKEITISSSDVTITNAIRGLSLKTSQKMLLTHLQILIIDEEIAKDDITDVLDTIDRDPQSNKQFQIAISKDVKASDILKVVTPLIAYPSEKIAKSIETSSQYDSRIKSVKYDEFTKIFLENGYDNTAPALTVEGDLEKGQSLKNIENITPDAVVKIYDTAIFKGTKLVGFMPEKYGLGFSSLTENLTNTVFPFVCDKENNYAAIEITEENKDIEVKYEDNKPKVKIVLNVEGNVEEVNCKLDMTKPETSEKLEKMAAKQIKKEVKKTIHYVSNTFESDIFGFGNTLYKSDYKTWYKVQNKWHDKLKDMDLDVEVNLMLHRKGLLRNTLKDDVDEN